ncbi:type I restriction endonuclease subunit M [Halobellus rarus]|uniref:Type I restriction endonuclease subunit M n=1 Tax=Halobellus rarus TaxID=1126237 RepID=A0ABD6CTR6_9EURY|nr:type I restriction endonuclease subunit M [Halobellus rarus]
MSGRDRPADLEAVSERCSRVLDTDLVQQYRSTLEASLSDPTIRSEFAAWREYIIERHGDVFADLADEGVDYRRRESPQTAGADPPRVSVDQADQALFVETLTFDFLLTELLDRLETRVDCTVSRPLAADAGVPFEACFAAVHERIATEISPEAVSSFDSAAIEFLDSAKPYDVGILHRECVSPVARRAFGRYDTPGGLAELAVDEVFDGSGAFYSEEEEDSETTECEAMHSEAFPTVVDPGCGAGALLAAAATRLAGAQRDAPAADRIRTIFDSVRGFDVAPNAVRASRVALVLAVRPLLEAAADSGPSPDEPPTFTPRVVLGDASEATVEDPPLDGQRANALLINPPWLTWDSLPETAKERWRTDPGNETEPDLFDRRGLDARLGYANDDLSVPYTLRCVHHLLRDGGRASVILKRDLLTGPAGEGLRRAGLGGRAVVYDCIHDFGSLSPFSGVDAGTALFTLRIETSADPNGCCAPFPVEVGGDGDEENDYDGEGPSNDVDEGNENGLPDGVPTVRWHSASPSETESAVSVSQPNAVSFGSLSTMQSTFDRTRTRLVPAEPDVPSSSWLRADAERAAIGTCTYRIRHGVKDDAKAVYAVDRETIERHSLGPDHIYPYLKSKHIVKYGLFGHDLQLVPQRRIDEDNEDELRRETPATYAYLDAHRDRLLDRGSSWFDDGPFYSLFGVGAYTWAEYKVVWCRLGFKPHFAVVSTVSDPIVGEKTVVPGDHCMFVGTDDEREAHYLCALLNSAPYQRCLRDISSGGKSSLSKSTVERLALPEWTARPKQQRLADLSQQAHSIVPDHVDCSKRAYNKKTIPELAAVQHEIDTMVEQFLVDGVDDAA